jgi:flagellar basal-body rod modification protein FlgD
MSSVTATNPVGSSTASAASSTAAATNSLSYNDFLTLLLAEMKNQDPTQPMDPSAMVSQLATVSQVGQAVQTNTTLSSMLTEASLTQAELAVGSTMTSTDGTVSGQIQSVNVDSSGNATGNTVNGGTITYSDGALVQ